MKEQFQLTDDTIQSHENLIILETVKIDSENFRAIVFSDPVTVLQTSRIDEIEKVLNEAEDFLKQGFYAAGYVTYEAGYAFEEKLKGLVSDSPFSHPLIWFGIFKDPFIIDLRNPQTEEDSFSCRSGLLSELSNIDINMPEKEYKTAIERIKDYIRSGDSYQINFTWNAGFSFRGSPLALYNDLKKKQKVGYAAFIKTGSRYTISLSPELFFRKTGKKIITRPMKGTMKRGRTFFEDRENMKLLQESKKNKAENLMIVDLLRNDLGKVCKAGSVKVKKLFEVEKYETLFQMTSTIEGVLKQGTTYRDIFKSLFPSGSVTGAPKIRSMEIINELEKERRGVYTGAIGFMSPHEEAIFNIAIRTPVIEKHAGVMGIGSGIVWDSDAEDEHKECSLKMKFLTDPVQKFRLLETMLHHKGKYRLLNEHIQRLRESAEYFGFPFNAEELLHALGKNTGELGQKEKQRIRVLVDRKGKINIENFKLDFNKSDKIGYTAITKEKTDSKNIFLFHKTTNRSVYDEMYERARERGLIDFIFTNEKGEITEGCISNIFIKRKGKLITPHVECGLLNGIMRQYILKKIKNVIEDIITPDDLRDSEKIFLSNSIRGIMRVELANEKV